MPRCKSYEHSIGNKYASREYKQSIDRSKAWIIKTLTEVATYRLIAAYNEARLNKKNRGTLKDEVLNDIARKAYPIQYENNPKLAKNRVHRMLKTKEVKELANLSLVEMLTEKGITPDWLTDRRKDIMDRAKDAKRLDIELKALEGFEEMHQLNTKVTYQQTTTTQDVDYSRFLQAKQAKLIEIEGNGDNESEVKQLSEAKDTAENIENEEKQPISVKQLKNEAIRSDMVHDNEQGNDNVPPSNKP